MMDLRKKQFLKDPKTGHIYGLPREARKREYRHPDFYLLIKDMQTGRVYDIREEEWQRMIMGEPFEGDNAYAFIHHGGNMVIQPMRTSKSKEPIRIAGRDIENDLEIVTPDHEFYLMTLGEKRYRFMPRYIREKRGIS